LRRAGADVLDRHATTFIGDIPSEFHYHVSETGERQACLRSAFAHLERAGIGFTVQKRGITR
jgi:hypothetical protein